ncbi:MAG: prepilin peptidase [Anaerolineae bacterium]
MQIAPTVPYRDYIIGGIAGFALFSILYLGGMIFSSVASNARGEEIEEVAFGYGDVLLAMLSGFILGWQALIFAVFIAVFAGGAGALLFLVIRLVVRGNYELFTALPYGQYIVFGTLIMLLWRSNIGNFLVGR